MRVAFITEENNSISGIVSYGKWLWYELRSHFDEGRIFALPGLQSHWNGLMKEVERYKPDLLVINTFKYSKEFIEFCNSYNSILVLHDLFKTDLASNITDTYWYPAQKGYKKTIVVHSEDCKKILINDWKLDNKIVVIPHGCLPIVTSRKRIKNSITQFGAGKPYKKYDTSIQVTNKLKDSFDDVTYDGLFGMFTHFKTVAPQQNKLFVELSWMIVKLKATSYIKLLRDAHTELEIDEYLLSRSVCIFPYLKEDTCAISGASRYAMSRSIPVIVSDSNLFSDLEGICPRASTVDQYVEEIKRLFDPKESALQVEKQNQFISDNSWSKVAKKFADIVL